VLPVLEELRPGAAARAGRSAALLADAARLVHDRAAAVLAQAERAGASRRWPRAALRAERPIVLGAVLREAAAALHEGRGRDRLTGRVIAPAIRAIRGAATDPKRFVWSGIQVEVTARAVELRRATSHAGDAHER
jgi:hypothetical protein